MDFAMTTLLGNLIELSKAIGLAMQRMRHEGMLGLGVLSFFLEGFSHSK